MVKQYMPGNCFSLQKCWRLFVILYKSPAAQDQREQSFCLSCSCNIFPPVHSTYANVFTSMLTNVPGVDTHFCITKCRITISYTFFCLTSAIERYDYAAIGQNLWSEQRNDKKKKKVYLKALVGFIHGGRTGKMLMRISIFPSSPFKREWCRDSKTLRGMMKGTWYIILLW